MGAALTLPVTCELIADGIHIHPAALALAIQAGKTGGILPCTFNAANEVAVASFLQGRLSFLGIAT